MMRAFRAAKPHGTLSNARRRRTDLGPLDGRDRLPARLPGCLQPGRLPRTGPDHEDRPLPASRRHQRLHLQQGAALRPAHLRRGSPAPSGIETRREGRGELQPGLLGSGPRDHRGPHARDPRGVRRRSHSPAFLWRLERPAVAGHDRRPPLPRLRRLTPRAQRLRRADDHRHRRALRPHGRRGLRGLSPRAAHRDLGGQPLHLRVPPRAPRARRRARRRDRRRHRSPPDAAGQAGGHSLGGAARDRRGRRAGDPPVPLRARFRGRKVSRRADAQRGRAPPPGFRMDVRARRGRRRGGSRPAGEGRGAVRGDLARRSSAAGGGWNATGTAATRRWRCWRCRPSGGSSACAAAGTR